MTLRTTTVSILAAAGGAVAGFGFQPEADPRPFDPAALDQQTMMQAMAEAAAPGPQHAWLGKWIGAWDTTTKLMPGPGAAPMTSEGEVTIKWLIDGVWLSQESTGEMLGQPAHGFGILGFDNVKRQYVGSWVHNQATEMLTMRGSVSLDGKTLTMFGQMDEPMTGEHGKMVKYVTRYESDDRMVFEIYEVLYGEPFKVVEVEYTRKK